MGGCYYSVVLIHGGLLLFCCFDPWGAVAVWLFGSLGPVTSVLQSQSVLGRLRLRDLAPASGVKWHLETVYTLKQALSSCNFVQLRLVRYW